MKNRKIKEVIKKAIIDQRDRNIIEIIQRCELEMGCEYRRNNVKVIDPENDPIGDKWRLNAIRDANAEIYLAEEEIKRYFLLIDRKES